MSSRATSCTPARSGVRPVTEIACRASEATVNCTPLNVLTIESLRFGSIQKDFDSRFHLKSNVYNSIIQQKEKLQVGAHLMLER